MAANRPSSHSAPNQSRRRSRNFFNRSVNSSAGNKGCVSARADFWVTLLCDSCVESGRRLPQSKSWRRFEATLLFAKCLELCQPPGAFGFSFPNSSLGTLLLSKLHFSRRTRIRDCDYLITEILDKTEALARATGGSLCKGALADWRW